MEKLISEHILNRLERKDAGGGIGLEQLDDGATISFEGSENIVFTTDSHTVDPLFFPGGDIGSLAVSGTINDLTVMGAKPIALSSSLIIEEGFSLDSLDRIIDSMNDVLNEVKTPVITGDTKVLKQGDLDGVIINTAGIGIAKNPIPDSGARLGDKIILTGPIGSHGMALMRYREGLSFHTDLLSDVAPIYNMLAESIATGYITAMKDPTRGGLANALNEMAHKSNLCFEVSEEDIPVEEAVRGISGLLGISPYDVANEGVAVITIEKDKAEEILNSLRSDSLGRKAAIIGEVSDERPGKVVLETKVGGRRFLEAPLGDPVPRIC